MIAGQTAHRESSEAMLLTLELDMHVLHFSNIPSSLRTAAPAFQASLMFTDPVAGCLPVLDAGP